MTGQILSYQFSYHFEGKYFQSYQGNYGLFSQLGSPVSPSPSPPAPIPPVTESVSVRKEQQRRRSFDRILQRLSGLDLPGRQHALDYMRHKFRRNCKKGTLEACDTAVRFFLTVLQNAGRELEDITRHDIEAFVEHEQDRGIGIRGVRTRMQMVYSFVKYLIENEVIGPDILFRKIKLKRPESLPRAIPPEDIKELLSVIDHTRNRALILLLLRTGMRIGELLDLRMVDIVLSEKKVLIITGEKNCRGRVVYFNDDAEEALKAWLEVRVLENEMLFYAGKRITMSYSAARAMFIKYLDKANLSHKGYSLHSLRHTFASEMLNAGLRLEVLQQLLGHSSLEVTRQYARLTDKTREKEYFHAMAIIERGEIHGRY